ncbi:MAG: hypothetical protein M1834_009442 [Cirrosporium novae-zelandiae]|nr:MAG: hypothetical protein M1834_009442 [Cirrosporium novae-zelandiae]
MAAEKEMSISKSNTTTTFGSHSDDDAVPDINPDNRLRAWKHACGYLENYISATEKMQKSHAKEVEKVLKTISDPLREGHHFDQSLGGIAGLFDNLRANTQGIANQHLETEKNLKGQILPILTRLHTEIKNKSKEVTNGAGKSAKAVEKARNETQKHIEKLGQYTAVVAASGDTKTDSANDPYVVQRGIYYRLNRQVVEENNNRQDLIQVQNSFPDFESHVLAVFQEALAGFNGLMSTQSERQRIMYGEVVTTSQTVPPDFEWSGFKRRNEHALVDPNAPPRSMDNANFPNMNHSATKPLIEGTLERRGTGAMKIKGYSTGYYAITSAHYIHEFKDNDNFRKDPTPELSLYLPDCTVGAVDGVKFNIKGKDVSGGKVGTKLSMTHEFAFKAHTADDAKMWWNLIRQDSPISPTSPLEGQQTGISRSSTMKSAGSTFGSLVRSATHKT